MARTRRGGLLLRSPLSDELTKAKAETWPKDRVFAALRKLGPAGSDADAKKALADLYKDGTDERWMAERLLAHGPEPLWPAAELDQRSGHAPGPEAGIAATLPYPPEVGKTTAKPVKAFFFPGMTARRALIIGGVHGDEPQGARVVESLRVELEAMATKGTKPHFTVILIPVLIERTHDPKLEKPKKRYVGGIEPNRTFPRPREDYADVRARVKAGQPELMMDDPKKPGKLKEATGKGATSEMIPETRALIALIERFKPERIASVHAHSIDAKGLGRPGDDPGVFVDPRLPKPGKTNDAEVKDDDALAEAMLAGGQGRVPQGLRGGKNDPYLGNVGGSKSFAAPTVRYAASHPQGHSLGDWAPAPTATREGITTVTVEVPQYGDDVSKADKLAVEEAHRDVLRDIFLGDPAAVAAAMALAKAAAAVKKAVMEAIFGPAAVGPQLQRKGWDDAREGGWNEAPRAVTGTQRIPVMGLKKGLQSEDPQGHTKESAKERAIVIVPDGVDLSKEVDVLLHFHGWAAGGFRERKTKGDQGPAGSVHDVEDDRIPQQLAAKGRNIVGVLPQGTDFSSFGISDPQGYVKDALALAAAELPKLLPKLTSPVTITPGRVIVSGHSGGGVAAAAATGKLTATAPTDDAGWARSTPIFLFDAINGTTELGTVVDMAIRWLEADLVRLNASSTPDALLDRRGIKLRSTHSNANDRYKALNVGDGSYMYKEKLVTISKKQSLKGRIDDWFDTRKAAFGTSLTSAVVTKWRAQYDVPEKELGGAHEHTVGTGQTAEGEGKKRLPAPAGVTGPSKTVGVPEYSGGGALDESLSKLPALVPPPPPPKHTQVEGQPDADAETAYA